MRSTFEASSETNDIRKLTMKWNPSIQILFILKIITERSARIPPVIPEDS